MFFFVFLSFLLLSSSLFLFLLFLLFLLLYLTPVSHYRHRLHGFNFYKFHSYCLIINIFPSMSLTVTTSTKFNLRIIYSPDMPPSKMKDTPYTWAETKEIVNTNALEYFARSKQLTESYHNFKKDIKNRGITVFKHLLSHQLQWFDPKLNSNKDISEINDSDIVIKAEGSKLFENDNDLKVLYNHFPYFFEDDVVHLCIWSKIPIPADPNSPFGDISPETRMQIRDYLDRIISKRFGILFDNICFFKNWEALQSVKAISHVHVIIKGITKDQLKELNVC